jgi:hypothetical protein
LGWFVADVLVKPNFEDPVSDWKDQALSMDCASQPVFRLKQGWSGLENAQ